MALLPSHPPLPAGNAAPSADAPLTPEHLRAMAKAQASARKVPRAAGVAAFNGWATAACAALTALGSLASPVGMILALGLGVVAFFEFRGAAHLRRLDARAARTLGWNQVFFAALLTAYALWHIGAILVGVGDDSREIAQYAAALGADSLALVRNALLAVYGCLIVVALAVQGSTALYYFTRARHVRQCLAQTPAWIIDLQQRGLAG